MTTNIYPRVILPMHTIFHTHTHTHTQLHFHSPSAKLTITRLPPAAALTPISPMYSIELIDWYVFPHCLLYPLCENNILKYIIIYTEINIDFERDSRTSEKLLRYGVGRCRRRTHGRWNDQGKIIIIIINNNIAIDVCRDVSVAPFGRA